MESNFQSRSNFLRTVVPAAVGAGVLLGASKPANAASVANVLIDVRAAPYNATGNGTTNDAPAIQAAINAAAVAGGVVWFPPGIYHLATGLLIDRRVTLEGPGWHFNNTSLGAWFRVSVAGTKAITVKSEAASGTIIRRLAFKFDQPAAAPGWQPANFDFAISIESLVNSSVTDVLIEDVHMLNPTRAIRISGAVGASTGRIHLNRISGEPLLTGIEIDNAMDVCRISNVHFWPYWSLGFQPGVALNSTYVGSYKMGNANAFVSYRNDNPCYNAVFTYGYARGFFFRTSAAGKTSRFRISNSDFDYTGIGIEIDGSNTDGMLTNVVMQGPDGTPCAILSNAATSGVKLQITNMRADRYGGNGIRIEGPNAKITLDNTWLEIWNQSGLGFPAIEVSHNTSKVVIGKTCQFEGGGVNGPITGGAATIIMDA